jgi:hypothetical protein
MGSAAFADCFGLTNATILNGVTDITRDTFADCTSLSTVAIPDSVTTIEIDAFGGCSTLESLTIPRSVTNIWDWAFNYCPNLSAIYFEGDAPSLVGYFLFDGTPNVTVYYLSGTSGWGATFSDAPTALWLPQAQTISANLGGRANQFGFNIKWAKGRKVFVEACTSLSCPDWHCVQTNTLTSNSCYFTDPQCTNYPSRFYRLRSQ